ncbi:hypothetical protein J6590_024583 [Homalodisca vitripennis]|nr:hypothetical protein J6590_024583 [Homalodisca vitripennis]
MDSPYGRDRVTPDCSERRCRDGYSSLSTVTSHFSPDRDTTSRPIVIFALHRPRPAPAPSLLLLIKSDLSQPISTKIKELVKICIFLILFLIKTISELYSPVIFLRIMVDTLCCPCGHFLVSPHPTSQLQYRTSPRPHCITY